MKLPLYYTKRKSTRIEEHISLVEFFKDNVVAHKKYRVGFHNYKNSLHVDRYFETLEEARQFRDTIEAQIQQIKLNNRLDEFNKIEKLEYPETLLQALDITPKNYFNYYDEILPDFEENYKNLLEKTRLTDRELTCINLYYKEYFTLEKVSQYLGVGKERVRQIIKKGMMKIKCKKSLLIQAKDKLELISKEERDKMLEEIKENMTIDVALEILKNANLERRKDKKEIELQVNEYLGVDAEIENLEFSVRTHNCLVRAGIETVNDLLNTSYEKLLRIRNLGRKSLREIEQYIRREYGYTWDETKPFGKAQPIKKNVGDYYD